MKQDYSNLNQEELEKELKKLMQQEAEQYDNPEFIQKIDQIRKEKSLTPDQQRNQKAARLFDELKANNKK